MQYCWFFINKGSEYSLWEHGKGLHGHWHMNTYRELHTTDTPTLWACVITCTSISFCGCMHSNPNSTSFVMGFPVFSRSGATFTQSTCGHGGKQMWEPQEASLASQTLAAASRGDPVRHQPCRSSVNQVSTGFNCSSFLFPLTRNLSHTHMQPPFPLSKKSEVSERDNWGCICYSCLSTSQWIWNYRISIFSNKLQLNIYVLLSNFMLVALFYITPAWPFALHACFTQLFPSHSINFATPISADILVSACVLFSSCSHLNPHQYHSINILLSLLFYPLTWHLLPSLPL